MAELRDAVPVDVFTSIFGEVRERVVASDIEGLMVNRPTDIGGLGMFIWDEMVHRGKAKKPFKIAPIVNDGFKGIYPFIQKELKREPVSDAYAVSYFNEFTPNYSFADVSIVHCYPNDIHIADVEFADTRRPLIGHHPRKGVHSYHGINVFGEFLGRLKKVAKSRDVSRISLVVGDRDLYPIFSRHGFKVSETQMAQVAFKGAGIGYPMILPV